MSIRHFILTEVSFIGGALLAPGSRVTSADLGAFVDPVDKQTKPVKPGSTLVEVDAKGQPLDDDGLMKLQAVASEIGAPVQIAAVAPFAPNPTRAQGAPGQGPGGVQLAEQALRTAGAEGVESDEAAEARNDQAEFQARASSAIAAAGGPRPEGVQRRGGPRAAPKRTAKAK